MRTRVLVPLVAPVLALALSALGARGTGAAPESVAATTGESRLERYQSRLAQDAARILGPHVKGGVKTVLAAHSVELWAQLTIYEWQGMVVRVAPSLDAAVAEVVARSRTHFDTEAVPAGYSAAVSQQATVHAVQGALSRVLKELGVSPPPRPQVSPFGAVDLRARTGAPASHAAPMPLRSAPTAVASPPAPAPRTPSPRTPAPRSTPAPAHAPTFAAEAPATPAPRYEAPSRAPGSDAFANSRSAILAPSALDEVSATRPALSPRELSTYETRLATESGRALAYEIEGGAKDALAAARPTLRAAPTVAAWKAEVVRLVPRLRQTAEVLERRAEVTRAQSGVRDAYESAHVQRAAVAGLEAGLESVLRQFGR